MKKFVCMMLSACMCAGLLIGCGTTIDSETSVVYVGENGSIVSLDVEQFEQDYYDAEELENYVNDAVSAYTKENGMGTVKVEELTIEGDSARLQMKYKSASDYSAFNDIELFQGNVLDALEAGYVFDGDFAKVENGAVVGTATKQEIYEEQELKVVIIRANMDVQVEGEICYVSCENVNLTGADSVSIREGYCLEAGSANTGESVSETDSFETEVYTFIVYK